MNTLLFSLALVCCAGDGDNDRGLPPATAEQKKLVEQMGDNSFQEREKASKALLDMMPKSLLAVEAAYNHKDLEIRQRAIRVIGQYYNQRYNKIVGKKWKEIKDLPSYWSLPDEEVTIKGKKTKWTKDDIKDGLKKYVSEVDNNQSQANESAERMATYDLIMALIKKNVSDDDITGLLDKMDARAVTFNHMEGPWGFFGPG